MTTILRGRYFTNSNAIKVKHKFKLNVFSYENTEKKLLTISIHYALCSDINLATDFFHLFKLGPNFREKVNSPCYSSANYLGMYF